MSDFLFSINVTIPIFLVMLVGYFLKNIGILDAHFVTIANKFNFKVTLPVLLFQDISSVKIREVFDLKFVLFCAIASSICFWGIWGLSKLFVKDCTIRGSFVQGSFRSSAAVMGLAFISNIYGESAMGPLMIIGAVPLYNIYSVLVLTFEANDQSQQRDTSKIKQAFINILKNPIIIAILLGLVCAFIGIDFPIIIDSTISNIARLATPLALVVLGAGFEGRKAIAKIKPTIVASLIKLVIQPLIFIPIAAYMNFSGEKIIAILIMLAAPSTPSCYIMAKNMKNDDVLSASIIVSTTLLAAVTLTIWIYLLKAIGLI